VLREMNADGTGQRTLSQPGEWFEEGSFDWSPDGRYLLASLDGSLRLVAVTTGRVVPIPNTAGLVTPAWSL
jgi:hypothetical protein